MKLTPNTKLFIQLYLDYKMLIFLSLSLELALRRKRPPCIIGTLAGINTIHEDLLMLSILIKTQVHYDYEESEHGKINW